MTATEHLTDKEKIGNGRGLFLRLSRSTEENHKKILNFYCFQWQSWKGEVVPAQAMKAKGGGADVQLHSFLTATLDRDKWSASRPGRFTPQART
jgi:hypothetical protein